MTSTHKKKTEFGVEVAMFCAEFGIKQKHLADRAGVKYSTFLDVIVGGTPGNELIPKVRETMIAMREEAQTSSHTA